MIFHGKFQDPEQFLECFHVKRVEELAEGESNFKMTFRLEKNNKSTS